MASVHDVAAYILERYGEMSAMKLQKLVYYCQAWSLVWDEKPLFPEPFQAWVNGPVSPILYEKHRGMYSVTEWASGNSANLTDSEKETIDVVLRGYGDKNAQQLSDLSHQETPWIEARRGLGATERGANEITCAAMHEYYSALPL